MGASNSRKSDEHNITQKYVSTSPKRLINKLHGNLQKNRSGSSSSEKIDSDSSTKKHLFKRRLTEDIGNTSPISSSLEDSPLDHSPMIAAAAKVSARYDQNAGSSNSPCVSQQMSSRLAGCLLNSNDDDDPLQVDKVQSNKPLIETTLRNDKNLQKEDLSVHKWLNSYSSPSLTQCEPIQDIVSDFYLGSCNEMDRRKQKDRQQRLVKFFLEKK